MTHPEISVVVPSHDRRLRLRWLLNALEEQTLGRERWELIVAHDHADEITEEPPGASGAAGRHVRHTRAPRTGTPPRQRNTGWRAAAAPLIAFTDDDCRPDPGWLAALLEAATGAPGGVIQGDHPARSARGRGRPSAARAHARRINPPGPGLPDLQCALSPRGARGHRRVRRELPAPAGEDTDLADAPASTAPSSAPPSTPSSSTRWRPTA